MRGVRARLPHLIRELAKFGIVGAVATVVDIGLFNVLRITALSHDPLAAKAVSTTVAATTAYVGNREWTWRHRDRRGVHREYPMFLLLSAVGLGIAEACLWVSHYVIGAHSVLADNIAANGFGLLLGMLWRFWSFRRWVFPVGEGQEA